MEEEASVSWRGTLPSLNEAMMSCLLSSQAGLLTGSVRSSVVVVVGAILSSLYTDAVIPEYALYITC